MKAPPSIADDSHSSALGRPWARTAIAVAIVSAVALCLYRGAGERVLEWIVLGGGGGTWLQSRLAAHGELPMSYYQARAEDLFFILYRGGVLFGLCCYTVACIRRGDVVLSASRRGRRLLYAGAAITLLAPWPWLKVVGVVLAIVGASSVPERLTWTRQRLAYLICCVFGWAFIVPPYWYCQPGAVAPVVSLAALLALAIYWSRFVARSLVLQEEPARWRAAPLIVTFLGLVALHARAMAIDLPWLTDEDYHVRQILVLAETRVPLWCGLVAVCGLVVSMGRLDAVATRRRLTIFTLVGMALTGAGYAHLAAGMHRYPYLTRWLQALPVQSASSSASLLHTEALLRSFALAALMLVGIAGLSLLPAKRPWLRAAWGLAILTAPIMTYYGSLLSLELPAVALCMLVCARAEHLLSADAQTMRRDAAWLALLMLGFIKESFAPFLLAFLLCRWGTLLCRRRTQTIAWRSELGIAAAVMMPVVLYLGFRSRSEVFRQHGGEWGNLLNPALWWEWLALWWPQFGWLLVAAGVGAVLLVRRAQWRSLALVGVSSAGTIAYYLSDSTKYVGYARFNLCIAGALLFLALTAVRALLVRRGHWAVGVAVLALIANAAMWPLRADGGRVLQWKTPRGVFNPHYYPYREALGWCRDQHPDARLFFKTPGYPYYHGFYLAKWNWLPVSCENFERATLPQRLGAVKECDADLIICQVRPGTPDPVLTPMQGFVEAQRFARDPWALVVYERGTRKDERGRTNENSRTPNPRTPEP